MSSMFKLQLAYDEAKFALKKRELISSKTKVPASDNLPLKNLSQITSMLKTYLEEIQNPSTMKDSLSSSN